MMRLTSEVITLITVCMVDLESIIDKSLSEKLIYKTVKYAFPMDTKYSINLEEL